MCQAEPEDQGMGRKKTKFLTLKSSRNQSPYHRHYNRNMWGNIMGARRNRLAETVISHPYLPFFSIIVGRKLYNSLVSWRFNKKHLQVFRVILNTTCAPALLAFTVTSGNWSTLPYPSNVSSVIRALKRLSMILGME